MTVGAIPGSVKCEGRLPPLVITEDWTVLTVPVPGGENEKGEYIYL